MRSRAAAIGVLLLVTLGAMLLGRALLVDDAAVDPEGIERTATEAENEARLVGTGRTGEPRERVHGTLRGRVTLDGMAVAAVIRCTAIDGSPLPDQPDDRWAWLLDHHPPAGDADAKTKATADGVFALDLAPGTWHVEAACEDGSRGWSVLGVTAERTKRTHLDVRSGSHVLRGRVQWADGRPMAGYVVARTNTEDSREWAQDGRTLPPVAPCDAEGRFTLPPLPPGPLVLHAVSPGVITAGRRIQVPWPHEITWVLDQDYRTLTGRVIDAVTGAPIAGARLRSSWGTALDAARTDADGRFSLRTDATQLDVTAAGYSPGIVQAPDDDAELTVRLTATARLAGRVLRARDRTPVEGAVVHARKYGVTFGTPSSTRSGPDGTWSLPGAPSGAVSLFVLGGGVCSEGLGDLRFGAADPFRVEVPPSGSVRRDLYVVDAARIEGRVVEADGTPASRVVLRLTGDHGMLHAWIASRRDRVAQDGAFAFSDVVPGVAWSVWISRAPLLAIGGPRFLLRPGEQVVEEIRLPARRRAVLAVRDATTDAALPHAWVALDDDLIRADATGRIVVEDLQSVWNDEAEPLSVEAPGYAPGWVDPWAEGGVREQVVRLQPSAGVLGRIEGLPEGASFSQVNLRVAIHVWHRIPVAPDGTFHDPSFPDVPDRLFASLKHEGATWGASALAEPGATDVLLTLQKQAKEKWWAPVVWRIHVVDPQGVPVPQLVRDVLHCTRSGCSGSLGFTEHGGTVTAQHGKGEFGWVRVRQARDAEGRPLGYAPVLVGPLGPEGGEVEVVMRPGLAIEGRVVDETERAVPGVRIDAYCAAHRVPDVDDDMFVRTEIVTAYADEDGRFRLDGLDRGVHTLKVKGGGRHAAPESSEVEAGRTDVVVVMRAAHAVDVTVEDPQGRPVGNGHVAASRQGGTTWAEADGRGLARFVGLDPSGAYLLKAQPPADRPDLREAVIRDWRPGPTTLRLVPGASLRGRLLGPEGGPVPSVGVFLFRGGTRASYDHTDADGTFSFRRLEPGETLGLAAESSKGEKPEAPVLEVTAGAKDVVLRFARGPALLVDVEGLPALDWFATVALLDAATGKRAASVEASRAGRAVFPADDLDPEGTYVAYVSAPDTYPNLVGYRSGVRLREEPWTVTMRRGETVRARITNPGIRGPRSLEVSLDVGWGIEGMLDPQGLILVPGVPPGRWALRVRDPYSGQVRARAEVEVPGPEVTLELEPAK